MRLIYPKLNSENIHQTVELLFQCFKQNDWIDNDYTDEDIKKCMLYTLQDPEAQNLSTIVVDVHNKYKIIGVYMALPITHYLKYSDYWEFHKHFSRIEEYFDQVAQQFGKERLERLVWSYWVSDKLASNRIPIQLSEVLSHNIKNTGKYDAVISFMSPNKKMSIQGNYNSQFLTPMKIINLHDQNAVLEFQQQKHQINEQQQINEEEYKDDEELWSKENIIQSVYEKWKSAQTYYQKQCKTESVLIQPKL